MVPISGAEVYTPFIFHTTYNEVIFRYVWGPNCGFKISALPVSVPSRGEPGPAKSSKLYGDIERIRKAQEDRTLTGRQ